jgi:hypothetical protein
MGIWHRANRQNIYTIKWEWKVTARMNMAVFTPWSLIPYENATKDFRDLAESSIFSYAAIRPEFDDLLARRGTGWLLPFYLRRNNHLTMHHRLTWSMRKTFANHFVPLNSIRDGWTIGHHSITCNGKSTRRYLNDMQFLIRLGE